MRQAYNVDVIVVGGGPAGLAAAAHLTRGGLSVVVVERSGYGDVRIGEHLPPPGMLALREVAAVLGLALHDQFRSAGVIAHWGSPEPRHTDYVLHPGQYGVNLSRPGFDEEFAQACEKQGAIVLQRASLTQASRERGRWKIDACTDDGLVRLTSRCVVDASGRRASFASKQRARIIVDERQVALVAFGSAPSDTLRVRSVVEAYEFGWWYWAPLSAKHCLCLLICDPDLIRSRGRLALAQWWRDQLGATSHIAEIAADYAISPALHVRPSHSQHLDRGHGNGWIAIGDAAFAQDPLSSQGISKALDHGKQASFAIIHYLSGQIDALRELSQKLSTEYSAYYLTKNSYYKMEQRWKYSTFWNSRQ